MKPRDIKVLLPIFQALADGKTIQHKNCLIWKDVAEDDCFGYETPENYRIKPTEPKLRPWKPEEVPIPCVVRQKNTVAQGKHQRLSVHCVDGDGVYLGIPTPLCPHSSQELLDDFQFSTDGGKTWFPCGVLE